MLAQSSGQRSRPELVKVSNSERRNTRTWCTGDSYAPARLPITADDGFAIASIMGTLPEVRVERGLGLGDVEAAEITKHSACEQGEQDEQVHVCGLLTWCYCLGFLRSARLRIEKDGELYRDRSHAEYKTKSRLGSAKGSK